MVDLRLVIYGIINFWFKYDLGQKYMYHEPEVQPNWGLNS